MDNLSHSLLGIHLSRLPAFRPISPRLAFWTGIAAANAPDVDGLLRWFGEDRYVFDHRGITHSLVGLLVIAPAVALIARWIARRPIFLPLLALALVGVLSHLVLDLLTSWGTMLLLPFSRERFAIPWLFIADVFVWAILGIPLLRTAWRRWRGALPDRVVRRSSLLALTTVSVYVAFCAAAHGRARQVALEMLDSDAAPKEVLAFPSPPGPLLWTTLVRTEDHLWHRGVVSALTGGHTDLGSIPTGLDDPRVQVALETELGRTYRWFAAALYLDSVTPLAEDGSYQLTLGDLRFSGPFWEEVPFQLWMEIGPDFRVRDWSFRTGHLSPDAPAPGDAARLDAAQGALP